MKIASNIARRLVGTWLTFAITDRFSDTLTKEWGEWDQKAKSFSTSVIPLYDYGECPHDHMTTVDRGPVGVPVLEGAL